jgi:hypothetical protein
MNYILNLYNAHKINGIKIIYCPICKYECAVPYDYIEQNEIGKVIVKCDQNIHCLNTFCYHCKNPCTNNQCLSCLEIDSMYNPNNFNYYFYNPSYKQGDFCEEDNLHLLKNNQITIKLAISQIEEILNFDKLTPYCFKCFIPLYKTCACNELVHCNIKKCYMCGKTTVLNGKIENNHWDDKGINGCPRFDSDKFWRKQIPQFLCREGICYNHNLDCTTPEHQPGIMRMHEERKVWHIWKMLYSLHPNLRNKILKKLLKNANSRTLDQQNIIKRIKWNAYLNYVHTL